ncbi:hypothetical protein SAMN05216420_1221, partial [Nitrosospira sp. Nl5]
MTARERMGMGIMGNIGIMILIRMPEAGSISTAAGMHP